nr:udp-glucuronate 4-epimerase 5 [Ipomoea batatas]
MTGLSHLDGLPSTPGKLKTEKGNFYRLRFYPSHFPRFTLGSFVLIFCVPLFLLCSPPGNPAGSNRRNLTDRVAPARTVSLGPNWEHRVRASALPKSKKGFSILVTGAAGFVGSHASLALKRRGDGVLGVDNFNNYYEVGLKRARKSILERAGVHIIEADINDGVLLQRLFDAVAFTHVMHLAAQAGVRYAIHNPTSYIHSNIVGFVALLEACKAANPQPAIVWARPAPSTG